MEESYKTIDGESEFAFEVKKSKFICRICHCETREEAESFFERVRQQHKQATHNVPAFVLRFQNSHWCSDDHEPQGTAGVPLLKVLEGEGLTDVAAVVTRYFGGTLLGTGGLVKAYSDAGAGAVREAKIKNMVYASIVTVKCDYTDYGKLGYILPNYNHRLIDSVFEADVKLKIVLDNKDFDRFSADLTEQFSARVRVIKEGEEFYSFE